ncbi:hypothetical protein MCEMSE15_00490 [Fimbriimonadaceae bacterium]
MPIDSAFRSKFESAEVMLANIRILLKSNTTYGNVFEVRTVDGVEYVMVDGSSDPIPFDDLINQIANDER